ncbi:ABC transporter permease [Demequina phytophila]|uniref:ABC transporter permease n=1 Tax=Demequina phytophila TaxID=1638981 RepID=UPI0007856619|nr:ABC transporter permease [Demequina phytophila]
MTLVDQNPAPSAAPEPASSRRPAITGNPWLPTPGGVWLVTGIELRRRRPTAKGWIFYGLLLAIILGLGILLAVVSGGEKTSMPMELVLVLVLGAGMLIAPSLAATSINGDSSEGVLAPLQMTRLTAGDLALGKLLASWLIAVVVLLTMTPFLVYAFTRSGWHWDELLIVIGVILLVVLTSTAIGLAWSAIAARAVASVSLAHLTTGALLLGTLLAFVFTQPLVSETVTDQSRYVDYESLTDEQRTAYENWDWSEVDPSTLPCMTDQNPYEYGVAHTERTAWLLLSNPVVLIGESSPIISYDTWEEDGRAAPGLFAEMHRWVSDSRIGPSEADLAGEQWDECAMLVAEYNGDAYNGGNGDWEAEQEANSVYPRAPWIGLGVQGILLLGSLWIVVARLRVPYVKLRQGSRVA